MTKSIWLFILQCFRAANLSQSHGDLAQIFTYMPQFGHLGSTVCLQLLVTFLSQQENIIFNSQNKILTNIKPYFNESQDFFFYQLTHFSEADNGYKPICLLRPLYSCHFKPILSTEDKCLP